MKKFMLIEKFKPNSYTLIYERLKTEATTLPEGLYHLNFWIHGKNNICFHLMETDHPHLFAEWMKQWDEMEAYEIFPIDFSYK